MKKGVLMSLIVLGVLFNGITTQAATNRECEHVSMTCDVQTVNCGSYPHQYVKGYFTLVCQVTLTREVHTYTCTSCGEIVDVIKFGIDEHHSEKHD